MKRIFVVSTILVGIVAAMVSLTISASDIGKEKRWADQVVEAIFDGGPVWLEADGHKFLGIYTEAASGKPVGGAIILHGMGAHPDWVQVINPLRVKLPEHGWATLSLQMPILPNTARSREYLPLFPEVAPRLRAGLDFLKTKGIAPVVIIGHSMGAAMGSYFLANSGDPAVKGFVTMGCSFRLDDLVSFKKVAVPVLDIYGSHDLERVVDSAYERSKVVKKAGNTAYQQIKVNGADHFYSDREDKLLEIVSAWLKEAVGK